MSKTKSSDLIQANEYEITDINDVKHVRKGEIPKTGTQVQHIAGQSIVTVEVQKTRTVHSFSADKIRDTKGVKYSDVTKGIRDPGIVKNSRFHLNELVRGPLSVQVEEDQRIETEIGTRLNEKLEAIHEDVRQKGYAEGFAAGQMAGMKEFAIQAKPKVETFERLIGEFEAMRHDIFKANEEFMLRMVYRLAKAVILRELNEDHDYTRRLVAQLLERMGTRENIKVFVGPKVFSAADALKEGLAQSLGRLKNLSIELDSDIPYAGCRVETDFGEVDARLEVQIRNIAQALGVPVTDASVDSEKAAQDEPPANKKATEGEQK